MIKLLFSIAALSLLISCLGSRISKKTDQANVKEPGLIPVCLQAKIKSLAEDPKEGSPLYVAEYQYKNQTVYYMASACCDRFNAVYDSSCHLLGYPDGGYTGKGDGKMSDFSQEAVNRRIVWKKE